MGYRQDSVLGALTATVGEVHWIHQYHKGLYLAYFFAFLITFCMQRCQFGKSDIDRADEADKADIVHVEPISFV